MFGVPIYHQNPEFLCAGALTCVGSPDSKNRWYGSGLCTCLYVLLVAPISTLKHLFWNLNEITTVNYQDPGLQSFLKVKVTLTLREVILSPENYRLINSLFFATVLCLIG